MSGLDNHCEGFVEGILDVDNHHLRTRHHDVTHLRLGYFENACEHALFFGVESNFRFDERLDFVSAPGLATEGAPDARDQAGRTWAGGTGRFFIHSVVILSGLA